MSYAQGELSLPAELVDQVVSVALVDHIVASLSHEEYPHAGWDGIAAVTQTNSLFRACTLRLITMLLPAQHQGTAPLITAFSSLLAGFREIFAALMSPSPHRGHGPELPCLTIGLKAAEIQHEKLKDAATSGGLFSLYASRVVRARHAIVWLRATAWERDYNYSDERYEAVQDHHLSERQIAEHIRDYRLETFGTSDGDNKLLDWTMQPQLERLARELLAVTCEASILSFLLVTYEQYENIGLSLDGLQSGTATNGLHYFNEKILEARNSLQRLHNDHWTEATYIMSYWECLIPESGMLPFCGLLPSAIIGPLQDIVSNTALPMKDRQPIVDLIVAWELRQKNDIAKIVPTIMLCQLLAEDSFIHAAEMLRRSSDWGLDIEA